MSANTKVPQIAENLMSNIDTVEQTAFCLECGVAVLNSIHSDMVNGATDIKSIAPALWAAHDYLHGLVSGLRQTVNDIYAGART